MKVLWFTNTASNCPGEKSSAGGGWISSLETAMRGRGDVELGVSFFGSGVSDSVHDGPVSYFPVLRDRSHLAKVRRFFELAKQDERDVSDCLRVVDRFQPDLIHVFGTERCFGLLCGRTPIPVVIHLQGLLVPYLNAWVPPGYRLWDYVRAGGCSPFRLAMGLRALAFNRHAASREREIMRNGRFFMGRTEWDRDYVSLYAPRARYFHCEEALRPSFFEEALRTIPGKPVFVSTLSRPLYKGHDVVLKTAKVLCETGHGDFEWRVFGVDDLRLAERKTGIRAETVHVRPLGTVPAERLRQELLSCTAYVHPSYIDNSPNSVCEAQALGVPVVATNVGGVSSIVENGRTGWLVPANDPVATASRLSGLASGTLGLPDGWAAGPRSRNDPARVAGRVVEIYREILFLT